MIDIHTHILPGVDDGARTMEDSLELARSAVENGIHTLIATPHHMNGKYDNPAAAVRSLVSELNEELNRVEIPLTVLGGQEVRLTQQFLEEWETGNLLCLNDSSYMLLEFPSSSVPAYTMDFIYELSLHNIRPIIAHPERNAEIARNPELLAALIERGALSQVTSHSINGLFGAQVQKVSLQLCKRNMVHFVSTDAHHALHRGFDLRQAYAHIERVLGVDLVTYYQSNAESVVNNQDIRILEPAVIKKSWYRFW